MSGFEDLEFRPGETARLYVAGKGSARGDAAGSGVVVLHPWWGLNQDVLDFADRLAGAGFAVVAPDMFGGKIETTIEGAEAAADGADKATVGGIVLGAVDFLRGRIGTDAPIAALGFSYGGAWAVWAPTRRPDLRATLVYYGTWSGPVLQGSKVPVLGHFAEKDPYETEEGVAEFEQGLRDAGREAEIYRYPGTGHWFAEPNRQDAYDAAAAELAFGRTVAFLERTLNAPRG